jgi:hypothetical protein
MVSNICRESYTPGLAKQQALAAIEALQEEPLDHRPFGDPGAVGRPICS